MGSRVPARIAAVGANLCGASCLNGLRASACPPRRLQNRPSNGAGRRPHRLDRMAQVDVQLKDDDAESLQLGMIDRGYPMPLYFTDPKGQESDRESARKAMISLHLFGKAS